MDSLHSKVSQLASRGRIDRREFGGCIWTSLLALLSADTGRWPRRRFVLGLILLLRERLDPLTPLKQMSTYLLVFLVFVIPALASSSETRLLISLDGQRRLSFEFK